MMLKIEIQAETREAATLPSFLDLMVENAGRLGFVYSYLPNVSVCLQLTSVAGDRDNEPMVLGYIYTALEKLWVQDYDADFDDNGRLHVTVETKEPATVLSLVNLIHRTVARFADLPEETEECIITVRMAFADEGILDGFGEIGEESIQDLWDSLNGIMRNVRIRQLEPDDNDLERVAFHSKELPNSFMRAGTLRDAQQLLGHSSVTTTDRYAKQQGEETPPADDTDTDPHKN